MGKVLDTIESACSLEDAEGAVSDLENVIHCAEADSLKWCFHFRDKIIVACADVWRIRKMVKQFPPQVIQKLIHNSCCIWPCISMQNDGWVIQEVSSFSS
jgi:hypothetical protein